MVSGMPTLCARTFSSLALLCICAATATAGVNHWTEGPLPPSGPESVIAAIALDPFDENVIYAITDGTRADGVRVAAFWRSSDGGVTWMQRQTPRFVSPYFNDVVSLLVSPTQPNVLYLLTQANVHHSADRGNTWTTKTLPDAYLQNAEMVIDPTRPDTIYVAQQGSHDFFSQQPTGGGVYRSDDAGQRWHFAGLKDKHLSSLVADPVDPKTLYAIDDGSQLFQTRDRGSSWENLTPAGARISTVAVDPIVPSTIYALRSERFETPQIYKSLDYARTWRPAHPEEAVTAYGIVIHPTQLLARHSMGVSRSVNGGESWTSINDGLEGSVVQQLYIAQSGTLFHAIADTPDGRRLFHYSLVPRRRRSVRAAD